jgi:structural maintenance of chromosome 2
MKPNEILGMVEEAAGTRMYETKRVAALKTIDKKQMKVDELNSVLSEEITPTLERLRGEKQSYLKWSKNSADIERIERFVIASEFMKAQQALDNNVEGLTEMEDKVAELEEEASASRDAIVEKEKEIAVLSSKLSGEFESVHSKAKKTEEKRSKELVKVTSAWQNCSAIVNTAKNDLKEAKASLAETASAIAEREKEMSKESQRIEQAKVEAVEAEKHYEQLKSDYQNMSAGIASSQGDEGRTLPDQICKAHSDSKTAEAKANQAKMKIDHLTKEIKVRLFRRTHCGCWYRRQISLNLCCTVCQKGNEGGIQIGSNPRKEEGRCPSEGRGYPRPHQCPRIFGDRIQQPR